jgi:hypothetical protein
VNSLETTDSWFKTTPPHPPSRTTCLEIGR